MRTEKQLKTIITATIQHELLPKFMITGVKEIRGDGGKLLAYVTELEPEGFIITAADTDISPILGYSFEGGFPFEDSKDNVWLHLVQWDVEARLKALSSGAKEQVTTSVMSNNQLWSRYASADESLVQTLSSSTQWPLPYWCPSCGHRQTAWLVCEQCGRLLPLLKEGWITTDWHQGTPYNNRCPLTSPGGSTRCAVGCTATAMAQIINYWKYPKTVQLISLPREQGGNTYTSKGNAGYINIDGDAIVYDFPSFNNDRIGVPSLNTKLWNINYDGNLDEEAYLCFASGISVGMNYGTSSGAWPSAWAYLKDFSYGSATSHIWDSIQGWSVYEPRVIQNIQKGWPVLISIGGSAVVGGHSVIVDGYQSTGSFHFHVNYGWGGSNDGWYNPPNITGYNVLTAIVDEINPKSAWPAAGADSRNTRRIDYAGPEGCLVKWIVSPDSSTTKLAAVIVGYGGKVFALCQARASADPGKLFVINPYGVVENDKTREIPPWLWSTNISWPAQSSTPGLPIYFVSGNRLYRFTVTGQVELCWQDTSDNQGFFYPTQVDGDGNIYITSNRKMASISLSGGLRWYKTLPASANFSTGVAIDDLRDRLYCSPLRNRPKYGSIS